MYLVYKYHIPHSNACVCSSFPVKSIFTGEVKNHCINICKMPSGRVYWVVPCVGLVAPLLSESVLFDIFSDGVFYNIDELFNSLSEGGLRYVLGMDKNSFYSRFRW